MIINSGVIIYLDESVPEDWSEDDEARIKFEDLR